MTESGFHSGISGSSGPFAVACLPFTSGVLQAKRLTPATLALQSPYGGSVQQGLSAADAPRQESAFVRQRINAIR